MSFSERFFFFFDFFLFICLLDVYMHFDNIYYPNYFKIHHPVPIPLCLLLFLFFFLTYEDHCVLLKYPWGHDLPLECGCLTRDYTWKNNSPLLLQLAVTNSSMARVRISFPSHTYKFILFLTPTLTGVNWNFSVVFELLRLLPCVY